MSGRFEKYGDAKRKSQIRKARHAGPDDLQKLSKKKPSKSLRPTKRRGI